MPNQTLCELSIWPAAVPPPGGSGVELMQKVWRPAVLATDQITGVEEMMPGISVEPERPQVTMNRKRRSVRSSTRRQCSCAVCVSWSCAQRLPLRPQLAALATESLDLPGQVVALIDESLQRGNPRTAVPRSQRRTGLRCVGGVIAPAIGLQVRAAAASRVSAACTQGRMCADAWVGDGVPPPPESQSFRPHRKRIGESIIAASLRRRGS